MNENLDLEKEVLDIDEIYENLDKMKDMKRYKPPTPGYFPSVAQINTYARSKKFKHMIPYFMWLEECLDAEERKEHKEAIKLLNKMIDELS